MKNVSKIAIVSALMGFVAACGSESRQSSTVHSGDIGGSQSKPSILIFSKDERLVDGALHEITVKRNRAGTYSVSHRVALRDFRTGQPSETTNVLVEDAQCTFSEYLVSCENDRRPVDGALIRVDLVTASNGQTIAQLTKNWYDRMQRKMVETTKVIAENLMIQKPRP